MVVSLVAILELISALVEVINVSVVVFKKSLVVLIAVVIAVLNVTLTCVSRDVSIANNLSTTVFLLVSLSVSIAVA